MSAQFVYITFPTREDALQTARHLIAEKLAACANLLAPVTSVFRWEGQVTEEAAHVLIAKTTTEKLAALRGAVLAHHPYSLPCIVAIRLDAATSHAPFIEWIATEVSA